MDKKIGWSEGRLDRAHKKVKKAQELLDSSKKEYEYRLALLQEATEEQLALVEELRGRGYIFE